MPFPGPPGQSGLPQAPSQFLPGSTGGNLQSVGNPDLSALAGGGSPVDREVGGEASLKFAFQAEQALDNWIKALPEDDEDGENSDTSGIRAELAEIKERLHDIAVRAVPEKRGPSVDLSGPVGPAGEGKSRF